MKGGEHVGVTMVKDLIATVEREKAEIGLFFTLSPPTGPMKTEAVSAGYYNSTTLGDFPKIQILTIDGLLKCTEQARHPDLSQGALSFKKAQNEKGNKEQEGLW